MNLALAQSNSGVEGSESPEPHMNGRHRRARPKRAIFLVKYVVVTIPRAWYEDNLSFIIH
jgi:hypothetical protein